MMRPSFFFLAFLPFLSAQEEKIPLLPGADPEVATVEAEPTDFIRSHEDENGLYLQTAVTTYKKNKVQVDLIGAIHIADLAYYKELNKEFATYPVVLFEMIGGENIGEENVGEVLPQAEENPAPAAPAKPQKKSALSFLGNVYTKAAEFLQLTDQRNGIDYKAKNFVHADLTLVEFQNLQEAKNETLVGTLLKGSLKSTLKPHAKPPSTFQLLLGIIQKDPDRLKKELLPSLAFGDETSTDIFGDSVIITDRNAKCLEVLHEQIAEGQEKIAIFYGAAHFPDLEKSLVADGFKQSDHRWLNAWAIPKALPAAESLPESKKE